VKHPSTLRAENEALRLIVRVKGEFGGLRREEELQNVIIDIVVEFM